MLPCRGYQTHAEVMKSMSKKQPTRGQTLAKAIIGEYKPKTVEDMQNALKDVFGPMFEAMLNGEMENHLGYDNNERGEKATDNRRNGYLHKTIKTSARSMSR